MIRLRNAESRVVQPRTATRRKDDIVRVALALQEHEHRIFAAVRRDVFRKAKAEPHIKLEMLAYVRNQNLEMIDALRHRAAMTAEVQQQALFGRHGGAEFERQAA